MASVSLLSRDRTSLLILLSVATLSAAGGALAEEPMMKDKTSAADHAGHSTVVVGILPDQLAPTVQVVTNGQAFGWLNYSASGARIRFAEPIADKLFCLSPGLFRIEAEKLEAPEVPSGGYATLCNLKPGEYDYEVFLSGKEKPLLGKIVVPVS